MGRPQTLCACSMVSSGDLFASSSLMPPSRGSKRLLGGGEMAQVKLGFPQLSSVSHRRYRAGPQPAWAITFHQVSTLHWKPTRLESPQSRLFVICWPRCLRRWRRQFSLW